MQQRTAFQPLVTAGVAAVGAGLIALTPAISNDLAADIQHSAATIQQRAVALTDYVANPIQTWIDVFEAAGINISSLATQFQAQPFPLAQQVAANFAQYGVEYVKPFQTASNGAVNFFLGTSFNSSTGVGDFVPMLNYALSLAAAGNISGAFKAIGQAYTTFTVAVGEPLETIPQILNPITQNLANTTDYLTTTALTNAGLLVTITMPSTLIGELGASLQNVYNSFAAGDPVGGIINAIDVPGEMTNTLLNGVPKSNGTYTSGILSDANGLAKILGLTIPQGVATDIVAPNAQNIMSGGSLEYALGYLANLVSTGFPSPQVIVDNLVNLIQTYAGLPSAAAAADVGGFAALAPAAAADSLATGLPGLSADVLKAFDPAAFAGIAGALGPSLAADVAGSLGSSLGANIAGSLAGTLAVEIPSLALHILSAL